MNKDIRAYIDKQPEPQQTLLKKAHTLIVRAVPGITEEMKYGVPWYGDRYYTVGLKDHVNVGFCIDQLSKKDLERFEGAGKTMRHVKLFSPDDFDEAQLRDLVKLVWDAYQ